METPSRQTPFTAGNILVSLGGLLIVIGIFVLISASWQSFTPTGRIITVILPLLLLYLLTAFSWGKSVYHRYAHYLLLTASVILPFVVGVILYQSNVYALVNWQLAMYCSLISLPIYIGCEALLRQEEQGVFVLLAAVVAALGYCITLMVPAYGYAIAAVILGLLGIATGTLTINKGSGEESRMYSIAGYTLFWFGLASWPLLYISGNQTGASLPAPIQADPYWISLGYALSAALLLVSAVFYSQLWQNNKDTRSFLDIRRVAEHSTAFFLCGPAVLEALFNHDSVLTLIALLLSILTLVLSYFIQVRSFRSIGYIALIVSALRLLLFALSQLSAFWPILLLVGGFLLIAIAYILTHLQTNSLYKWLWQAPSNSLFKLGEEPAQPATASSTLDKAAPGSSSLSRDSGWQWLLLIIVILLLLMFL